MRGGTAFYACTLMKTVISFAASSLLLSVSAFASGGGAALPHAGTDLEDVASLQRGAKLYLNYCAGCHSLKYVRYSRIAEDLGLTEDQVMSNLNFSPLISLGMPC